jgi:hypothetical protein
MKYLLEMDNFGLAFCNCPRRAGKIPDASNDPLLFPPIARLLTAFLFLGFLSSALAPASADWPGAVPKWSQLDSDNYGVSSNIDDQAGTELAADDFLCTSPSPIAEIRFRGWGWDDGNNKAMSSPDKFRITFWSDVGRTLNDESHPGLLLRDIYVDPVAPGDPNQIGYQFLGNRNYLINLPEQNWFWQQGTPENPMVYWIGIQAVMPNNGNPEEFVWMFQNRNDETWGDDAVSADGAAWGHWGWPSPDPASPPDFYQGLFPSGWYKSADMAFEISTAPEPSTSILLGIGAAGLALYSQRRKARGWVMNENAACFKKT